MCSWHTTDMLFSFAATALQKGVIMTNEKQSIVNNPALRDNSSKLIFADSILSAQFFRDYADMEILRNIRPEDVEDVSERYVPLYSTERESDTVKRVNISKYITLQKDENPLKLPLYVISLIEHKTKVEYNVVMQLMRYMIHIWEDYEKEMEKNQPRISNRRDFRYPPILPIVYYEGQERWTAPLDLADRILYGELLGKYLPHFRYQLITLHEYSNEALLAKGDEISLAMLINKIQSPEDMSAFAELPDAQVDEILKDTPEYLLEIMAKVLRALLYGMNLPEDDVEGMVAKIKERKMGRLFENVTFDFQAERRNMEKAREELAETQEKLSTTQEKLSTTQEKLSTTQEKLSTTQEKLSTTQEELSTTQEKLSTTQEKLDAMQMNLEMYKQISGMFRKGCSDMEILEALQQKFSLTEEQARKELEKIL